jgi:hypothetical protein
MVTNSLNDFPVCALRRKHRHMGLRKTAVRRWQTGSARANGSPWELDRTCQQNWAVPTHPFLCQRAQPYSQLRPSKGHAHLKRALEKSEGPWTLLSHCSLKVETFDKSLTRSVTGLAQTGSPARSSVELDEGPVRSGCSTQSCSATHTACDGVVAVGVGSLDGVRWRAARVSIFGHGPAVGKDMDMCGYRRQPR